MRILSIDFDHAIAHEEKAKSDGDLSWLGDLSPELTVKKSVRFITQAVIGAAMIVGFLALI